MRTVVVGAGLLLMGCWPAGPVLADCPDLVVCEKRLFDGKTEEVGHFNQDTCWKFAAGCRPWHCEEAPQTNRDHWTEKCTRKFPNDCPVRTGCVAKFPGGFFD